VIVARHYQIAGRVQGVGFRYFAADAAGREGLHGYVRNLRDGSVEAEAEGDEEAVERFERAIRRGPPSARVNEVSVTFLSPSGRRGGFEIRP
jgi:acylphosphatase